MPSRTMTRSLQTFMFAVLMIDTSSCIDEASYSRVGEGYHFKPSFVVFSLDVRSRIECGEKCTEMGEACGSFSLDKDLSCRLSFLRVPSSASMSAMFDNESGVTLYAKKIATPPPAGDVLTLSTQDGSYILVNHPRSWYDAFDTCPLYGDGFHLAAIESDAEQLIIASWMLTLGPDSVWLAGNDEGKEGCWVWAIPGLPYFSYTAWDTASGQPNNLNNNQHCNEMYRDHGYRWSDYQCSSPQTFLCKRLTVLPATDKVPTLAEVHSQTCG